MAAKLEWECESVDGTVEASNAEDAAEQFAELYHADFDYAPHLVIKVRPVSSSRGAPQRKAAWPPNRWRHAACGEAERKSKITAG